MRLRSSRMVLLVVAVTTIALAGVLVLYLQGHRPRVTAPSAPAKAASSCDTPPAAAPPPAQAPTPDAKPDFLTFAACGDDAKAQGGKAPGKATKPASKPKPAG